MDYAKWYIGIGLVGALVLGWFALGQPGRTLQEGDYRCSTGDPMALGGDAPGATVEGGQVVDVWDFNFRTGKKKSVPFSDVERQDPKKFTMTSVGLLSGEETSFVCTLG